MSDLGLSGLASGVDTSGIVEKLMAVDRQAVTAIQNKQTITTAHQTALKAVADKLSALQTAANALTDSANWKATQSVVSSDDTKVSVSMLSGAGIGGHTVQVDRLASSAQHGFTFASNAAAGSLTLYYGSDPNATGASKTTISVAANASAKDVASAINASDSAPVYAAVVTDADGSDRLVLSARKSGQSSDFTVDPSALASGQLSEDATYARTGATLNASYKIDGEATARSSESNSIDNAVPGLRLTLKGITTSPVSVTTTEATIDKSGVKTKVQAFVDAYNSLVDLTRTDIAEKKVVGSTATSDLQKGTLFGDLGLDSMLSSIKNTMTQTLSNVGSLTSLADIGITVPKATGGSSSEDAKAGKLTFDSTKLDSALDTDYSQVQKLFSGIGIHKGFGYLVSDLVNQQNGLHGVLTGRINSDTTVLNDFTKQISDTNDRLSQQEARLKAQFAAMETALQNSQSQQAWLTGEINSLG
jgi:flagellar hook-associated protein 2